MFVQRVACEYLLGLEAIEMRDLECCCGAVSQETGRRMGMAMGMGMAMAMGTVMEVGIP